MLDRRGQVLRHPLVASGLRVARRNKLDPRLLESKDARTNCAQAAKADEGYLETTLSGHLVECVCVCL